MAAIIATGRPASATNQGASEEETEKRLGALLMDGDLVILLDNCTLPVEGDFLCSLLTQEIVRPRILGKSEAPRLATNVAVFATGNNLAAKGDMLRRMLRCTIDPQHERPETREFSSDPVEDAKRDRMQHLAAALTILRAHYLVALAAPTLGSFEHWSKTVRSALLWLGEPDPCDTMADIAADDPEKERLGNMLHYWAIAIGPGRVTVKQAIDIATNDTSEDHRKFYEALRTVAVGQRGDSISPDRLGKYLARHQKRIVAGRRLVKDGSQSGSSIWRLDEARG
jgi:putative DNA primase/helicase